MEIRDPEFGPALVNIRNSISRSPGLAALAIGLGAFWFKRKLLGVPILQATLSSALLGASAAGAMIAAKSEMIHGEEAESQASARPKPKLKAS